MQSGGDKLPGEDGPNSPAALRQRIEQQQAEHQAAQARREQQKAKQRQQALAQQQYAQAQQRRQQQKRRQAQPAKERSVCPQGTVEVDPCKGKANCNKMKKCVYPKRTYEIDVPAPVVVPKTPEKKERATLTQKASPGKIARGRPCPKCHILVGRCPYEDGVKCAHAGYCKPDPKCKFNESNKPKSSGSTTTTTTTVSSNDQPTSSSETSQGGGNQSPSSDTDSPGGDSQDESADCPGPADHRRPQGTCLVVTTEWGECYDKKKKLRLRIRNRCDMRVYMAWELETDTEYGSSGADGVKPGKTKTVSACGATGTYELHATFSPKPMKDWTCSDWH